MRKHLKRHALPLTTLLILALLFAGYEYYQNQKITQTISKEVSLLQEELVQLKEKDAELSTTLKRAEQNIGTLSSSVEEKGTQIKGLTGEIQQIKNESSLLEEKVTNLKLQNQDFSEVIENSIPSVVSIRTNVGSGSGFLVREDGYIVTNTHVIDGATAATIVTSDEKEHGVLLIGKNSRADIAVVKISGVDYSLLGFGDSDKIIVGEKVIAIGNPGGLDFTVTQGIVSAAHREDSAGNLFVQIDVPINPGNSGGPLLNAAGKVIGVTTKKIADFEGVGFAIESNQVQEIVEGMIDEYETSLAK